MIKKFLLCGIAILFASCASAQEVFWGYDEQNRELLIPPECDSVQETSELYEIGMRLFEENGYASRGASYCLLAAAMENHPKAQYQVATMYHKGILLPKSDLAAYKWATLAALNGEEEADRLGASIEQFLSTQDIELSTRSLDALLPMIMENSKREVEDNIKKQALLKQAIKAVNAEVRDLKKYGRIRPATIKKNKEAQQALNERLNGLDVAGEDEEDLPKVQKGKVKEKSNKKVSVNSASDKQKGRAKPNEAIYSQQDLNDIPMPSSI